MKHKFKILYLHIQIYNKINYKRVNLGSKKGQKGQSIKRSKGRIGRRAKLKSPTIRATGAHIRKENFGPCGYSRKPPFLHIITKTVLPKSN